MTWLQICFSPPWTKSGFLSWLNRVLTGNLLSRFSRVRLCATPWTAAYQAPPSMGFSRQEYWSGVPLPSLWQAILFFKCFHLKVQSLEGRRGCVDSQPCQRPWPSPCLSWSLQLLCLLPWLTCLWPFLESSILKTSGHPSFFAFQGIVKLQSSQNQFYG